MSEWCNHISSQLVTGRRMARLESWVRGGCWVLTGGKSAELRDRSDTVLLSVTFPLVLCDFFKKKSSQYNRPQSSQITQNLVFFYNRLLLCQKKVMSYWYVQQHGWITKINFEGKRPHTKIILHDCIYKKFKNRKSNIGWKKTEQ